MVHKPQNNELEQTVTEVSAETLQTILLEQMAARHVELNQSPEDQEVRKFLQNLTTNGLYGVSIRDSDGVYKVFHPTIETSRYYNVRSPSTNITDEEEASTEIPNEEESPLRVVTAPVLVIDDLSSFVTKLRHLEWVESRLTQTEIYPEEEHKTTMSESIWFNATPLDFANPEPFITKYIQFLNGYGLESVINESIGDFKSQSLQAFISIKLSRETSDYETPISFAPTMSFTHNGRQLDYELCKVRMGIYEDKGIKHASIFAVQKGWDVRDKKSHLISSIETIELFVHDLARLYKGLRNNFPQDFQTVFGNFPEELFTEEDDQKFFSDFRCQLIANMVQRYGDKFLDNPTLIGFQLENEFSHFPLEVKPLASGGEYIDNIAKGIRFVHTMASDSVKNIRKYQKEIEDIEIIEGKYKLLTRGLKTPAPPNHAAGLTAALSLLQSLGVTEVEVPLYLPLRVTDHEARLGMEQGDTIDTRKLDNLIEDLAYISTNTTGVEVWQDPGMSEDNVSYLTLHLSPMSSSKPLLQDFINAGKAIN